MKIRVGHGYDVHRWGSDKPLILGGIEVPHSQGLEAHSDGDVILHAVTDALLGALALGDIGQHFPDTDEQYKGADSAQLLEHAVNLCQQKEFQVGNIDVTIVAQAPKMAPHIDDMRARIAGCLKTCVDNVNVKATTTEKLGFVGREEGIACHAVVLMESF
ncbi:2-C-methyl-D-erythritol 2,4-cyclodiphosphate synthase [Idiomarina sp.]|uniref:2-C-methyl-D-erythritol 2,4-cyclodiphosphate synthase n=1 Tax=Idiomarina sp. TaxID=1874361 RepID=UPI001DBB9E2A|nr:2-C-methyl-D-erythritol 2,4-cyclodiphosphate synthase [Idiomarina sp.]MCJ8315541.1 2-C-methyl-D-erythritol 2,4-cyclodiphosphate synthase [Idiomarina sp.]NQZ15456.1 2-C-methyl-D-erythritol 2,4-cyclodiphosphate synthase [Idiomarina sp.]